MTEREKRFLISLLNSGRISIWQVRYARLLESLLGCELTTVKMLAGVPDEEGQRTRDFVQPLLETTARWELEDAGVLPKGWGEIEA